MAGTRGRYVRPASMACMHVRHAWLRSMDCTYGRNAWPARVAEKHSMLFACPTCVAEEIACSHGLTRGRGA
eukprot:359137-Chlamydomonas_euryale.AAC.4